MTIRRLTISLLAIYALLTLYTLIGPSLGLPYHLFFTPLLTLVAFTFALLHGSQNLGWKQTLLLLGLTFVISLLFECVGVATGWVYGAYHYTDKLGYKFLGLVPLLIPVAWFMMTYPSLVISRMITPTLKNVLTWRLLTAAIGAVAMTAWDLAMDPMMVSGGHWIWDQAGAYFGIPLQNYWGWWLTSFLTFFLFLSIARIKPGGGAPRDPYNYLAIWSYVITGLGSLLADFEFGLPGPALVGIFAMLPWVVMGLIKRE
ncbi:MAG: hypothetical protein C3F13_06195 [Anaerolineales bacterium]|nr:carotenoid biosynthesis protein [Anaerolineae bacterium]PWB54605.1 MAG: hypothetical protein C3F13_06195 [Anaerolineales bacterium]